MEVLNCIGMCVLGQMRHEMSRSGRRIEGFEVCFWVKRRTKSQDSSGKWGFWIVLVSVFWVRCVMKNRDQCGELKVLECVFWVKLSTKSRDVCGKMEVFNCNVVLGQMCHEKSRSVRRFEGFDVCFWVTRFAKRHDI